MTQRMVRAAGWVAAGCLMVVMTAAPVLAQGRARVNIPFAFEAGTETMPAGQYLVERSALVGTSLVKIHSLDLNRTIALVTIPAGGAEAADNPRLKFEMLAGTYRLSEIWTPGGEVGALLPRTKEQALLARQEGKVKTIALSLARAAAPAR